MFHSGSNRKAETPLSKRKSNLKQKSEELLTPLYSIISCALSKGATVILYLQSVSYKNIWIEASDWLLENFHKSKSGFWNTRNKMNGTMWRGMTFCAKKLCQKLCTFYEASGLCLWKDVQINVQISALSSYTVCFP